MLRKQNFQSFGVGVEGAIRLEGIPLCETGSKTKNSHLDFCSRTGGVASRTKARGRVRLIGETLHATPQYAVRVQTRFNTAESGVVEFIAVTTH